MIFSLHMSSSYPVLRLKPERETHLKNRHHSIFRTAFGAVPNDIQNGALVEIQSSTGDFLCYATLNKTAYIAGRVLSFEKDDPLETLRRLILRAIELRTTLFAEDTNAIRLINAEGDGIPGLIVDQYADTLVLQISTLGMDRLKPIIVQILADTLKPKAIFEKSTGAARRRENLQPTEKWLMGKNEGEIIVRERGLQYSIALEGSQKTGFFLDQREMRSLVQKYATGRTVLDCCSYVGGFSVNALAGGAQSADAVDYDEHAIQPAKKHVELNGLDTSAFEGVREDVFDFLRRKPSKREYDFIILDPPAFAKRSTDLHQAKGAYTDMNRMALQLLPPKSLLLTCSCSFQVDTQLFQTIVFHAARQANRSVKILQRHRQAIDHTINLFHPETDYLKSLLLWVE